MWKQNVQEAPSQACISTYELIDLIDGMSGYMPDTRIAQLLHPRNAETIPQLPLRRQNLLLQIPPIQSPQDYVEHIGPPVDHREDAVGDHNALISIGMAVQVYARPLNACKRPLQGLTVAIDKPKIAKLRVVCLQTSYSMKEM